MNVILKRFISVAWVLLTPLSGWAHGGEDHGEQAAPVTVPSAAPRLTTHTDLFELVGVLQGKVLTLYLDQFGTNAPVVKAQIELESGSWKGTAIEVAPAVYTVAAESLAQPGKHPIAITVQAGEDSDLMDASLEVGIDTHASAAHVHFWGEWAVWLGASAIAMASIGLVLVRRNKRHRQRAHGHAQL